MGQAQSSVPPSDVEQKNQESTSVKKDDDVQSPSLEDLIAEATAFVGDENESLDVKAQKALECPCIADLRSGPCGASFSEAFVCFLKSSAEEKGSDCVHPFVALQNCIKANPGAFSKDVLEGNESEIESKKDEIESKKEEKQTQGYRVSPPSWAKEPQSNL